MPEKIEPPSETNVHQKGLNLFQILCEESNSSS